MGHIPSRRVKDASGQSLAYVYGRESKADADIANVLMMDEASTVLPWLCSNRMLTSVYE